MISPEEMRKKIEAFERENKELDALKHYTNEYSSLRKIIQDTREYKRFD
jgi:hypothetical protein